jgi:uncharacterized protein with von Willebrand factor type A (vWA) domain
MIWDDELEQYVDEEDEFYDNPLIREKASNTISADDIHPFTQAESSYLDRGVENYLFENNLLTGEHKLKPENIEDGIAMLHTLSHTVAGGSIKDVKTTDKHRMERFKEAVEAIDFERLTGDNLTEKSLSGARLIQAAVGDTTKPGASGKKMQRKLKEAQDAADEVMKKTGGKKGGIMDEFLDGDTPEEKVANLPSHLHKALTLIGRVKQMGTINFTSRTHRVDDDRGSKVHLDYAGMSRMEKVDLSSLTPDNIMSFVTDQMPFYQEHRERPEKRVIFALWDFSGSMDNPEKQGYVLALFINLFEAVAQGDCTVIVAPFIRDIGKITVIQTKAEAVAFLKTFSSPCGGTTDVNSVILKAHSLLDSGVVAGYKVGKDRAEVIVINDGEDDVDETQTPPFPTHAICLGVDNDNLKTLCKTSKGTYLSIAMGI